MYCDVLQVLEAAVIALPDERWGERPLLIVVPQSHAGQESYRATVQLCMLTCAAICATCGTLAVAMATDRLAYVQYPCFSTECDAQQSALYSVQA